MHTVDARFLPYEKGTEILIHGREYVVTFGVRDLPYGPLVWPIVYRMGVN